MNVKIIDEISLKASQMSDEQIYLWSTMYIHILGIVGHEEAI